MLKVCWDCLAGNRYENDANGITALNRDTFSTPWPISQLQNGIMFRLPKVLNSGDKIKISGIRQHDRESFAVSFMTGIYTPDSHNVACKIEANYENSEEQLLLSTIQDGQKDETVLDDSPSDHFPDQYFDVSFELRLYENTNLFDVYAGVSFLGTVTLHHNLRDVTFITVSPETMKVNELKFTM